MLKLMGKKILTVLTKKIFLSKPVAMEFYFKYFKIFY